MLTPYLAISVGGALGADVRYLLASWVTTQWGTHFPVATLLINVSGSCALGVYLTLVTERFTGHEATRLFVATGFLGAYTTFSTFSVEALRLIETGEIKDGKSIVGLLLASTQTTLPANRQR